MKEVGKSDHQDKWIEAFEAKFEGKGNSFKRHDFDIFLGGYMVSQTDCTSPHRCVMDFPMQGVSDIPAAAFPEELMNAYPEAKIVLTTRDEGKWYHSMMATLIPGHLNAQPGSNLERLRNMYHKHLWNDDFPKYGRECLRRHNEIVREHAPKYRFLQFEVMEGWQPLCAFLYIPVPCVAFPHADDWRQWKQGQQ